MRKIKKKWMGMLSKCLCGIIIFSMAAPCPTFGITAAEEEKLSRKFLKIVIDHFQIVDDPFIVDYINETGKKITSHFPSKSFDYHFYAIKQDSYNAFAMPAGHIFINTGLIMGMESEDELAGILAHEIAHVYCRHISQRMDKGSKISFLTAAGLLAGIFLGSGIGGAASNALAIGSMATGQSLMLAYSREHEMQADQVGLKYLLNAGYSGHGLLQILKKMRSKTWFTPDQIPTYLTTHPAVEDRMVYLETQLKANPATKSSAPSKVMPKSKKDLWRFEKARIRTIALYGDARVSLNHFKQGLRLDSKDLTANYGYGLTLARVGQVKQAEIFLLNALENKAFDANIIIDLARVYFLMGKYEESKKMLEGALSIEPANIDGLFLMGSIHMTQKNYDKALPWVQRVAHERPDYKDTIYRLGKIYGKKKDMGNAHYYLGVYHQKKSDWANAAFHLKRAITETTDSHRKEEMEKMLENVLKKKREEERQLEEEEKNRR